MHWNRLRVGIFAAGIALACVPVPRWAPASASPHARSPARTWERLVGTPPANGAAATAYDSARRRVVLFGGYRPYDDQTYYSGETWEWNGRTWAEEHSQSGGEPPPRVNAAMAYDTARRRIVLFGGALRQGASVELGDTWEWDGTTWVDATPEASPSPRSGTAMAYDAGRHRVVLFGGGRETTGLRFRDTWEWDGGRWRQRHPTVSPPARMDHALAYDAQRGRIVLFGGRDAENRSLGDTWEWDGRTWKRRSSSPSPAARWDHALAYDAQRGRIVLFGGVTIADDGTLHKWDDTWEWSGTAWLRRQPLVSPPGMGPDASYAAAYDTTRQRVVLYGGGDVPERSGGTWEWDGRTWRLRLPRAASALAYDAARGRVVLFWDGSEHNPPETWELVGTTWRQRYPRVSPGDGAATMTYDEARDRVLLFQVHGFNYGRPQTWEWDGNAWTDLDPPTSPTPRDGGMAIAYDAVRERVVVYGGWYHDSPDCYFCLFDDTWEFDGTTWLQRTPETSPPPLTDYAMTYDAARQRVIVFGGREVDGRQFSNSTWGWDGTRWAQFEPQHAPSERDGAAMAYDAARGRIVLYGGRFYDTIDETWRNFNDTWEWDGTDWHEEDVPTMTPPTTNLMVYDATLGAMIAFANNAGGTWAYRANDVAG